MDEEAQRMYAIRSRPQRAFPWRCAHTKANFKSAFWRSDVLRLQPYETWHRKAGAATRWPAASARLDPHVADLTKHPPLNPAIAEALAAYVAAKKSKAAADANIVTGVVHSQRAAFRSPLCFAQQNILVAPDAVASGASAEHRIPFNLATCLAAAKPGWFASPTDTGLGRSRDHHIDMAHRRISCIFGDTGLVHSASISISRASAA